MFSRAIRVPILLLVAVLLMLGFEVSTARAEQGGGDLGPRTGLDVSWPQCGRILPAGTAYAIVGVNGGTAANTNPCLADQLAWAFTATTAANPHQPAVQLYINTGNPGDVLELYNVTTWPIDNLDGRGENSYGPADESRRNPYGRCTISTQTVRGLSNDLACSWQYGWNRAVESVDQRLGPAARQAGVSDNAADYRWWLDVETMNSWQHGDADADARNTATLEGMTQFYLAEGASVGIYSTSYQWSQIVGTTVRDVDPSGSAVGRNLIGLPSWLAGAADQQDASTRCTSDAGLTGGPVTMIQYIEDDLDHNYSCL
ncbi:hypothetical protein GCM10022236_04490 [Microlunatus ginsengisoli]|uniref:Uncharacterized protein n=2 Tax=Microlunatus ginsengisoli TaxID=363863 RepID=A0ABP6ZCX0_9ACTN